MNIKIGGKKPEESKCDNCKRSDQITAIIGNTMRCACGTTTTVTGGIYLKNVGGAVSFG